MKNEDAFNSFIRIMNRNKMNSEFTVTVLDKDENEGKFFSRFFEGGYFSDYNFSLERLYNESTAD